MNKTTRKHLNLNFNLGTIEERTSYLKEYINSPEVLESPLTQSELEICANYVLWGKDATGKSLAQKGIYVHTKKSTWKKKKKETSLEQLMENPTFNEGLFIKQNAPSRKTVRENFNREKELTRAPQEKQELLKELWEEIDWLDIEIELWEELNKKRTKPIRQELLDKFSEEELLAIKFRMNKLTQNAIIAKKHLLVEKRQEQFLIRDSYVNQKKKRQTLKEVAAALAEFSFERPTWEEGLDVFPLGLFTSKKNRKTEKDLVNFLMFLDKGELVSGRLSEAQEKLLSNLIWEKKKNYEFYKQKNNPTFFDFRNEHHVAELLIAKWSGVLDDSLLDFESTTKCLLDTLDFYINWANFEEKFLMILDLKSNEKNNAEIANVLNQTFGTKHSFNYISVLFRQKIIKRICNAAIEHEEVINKIFFKEEFKQCRLCGKVLLLNRNNFVKKTKAADGFCSACRHCEKKIRDEKRRCSQNDKILETKETDKGDTQV